jgi:hypothetical protein
MGSSTSGGSTIYPIGFAVPNPKQSAILAMATIGGSGGTGTIYACPAGCTAYITGFYMLPSSANGAVYIGKNGSYAQLIATTATAATISGGTFPIISLAAGDTCDMKCDPGGGMHAFVWGWVQTA